MIKLAYDSTKNADLFYKLRVFLSDPFFFLDTGEKQYVFLDRREFELVKQKNISATMEVVLREPLLLKAKQRGNESDPLENFVGYLVEEYGEQTEEVRVPFHFPLSLADFLRARGVRVIPVSSLYPEREQKIPSEIEAVRQSIRKTEKAFAFVENILRESVIRGESIVFRGEMLTSEFLKMEAEKLLIQEGMVCQEGIIISSGQQTAIPHHPGEGPILPNAPIVCDLFPRNRATGYFADITRTFVKGTPSKKIEHMYDAVLEAQEAGMREARAGKKGKDIHEACSRVLLARGYDVGEKGFVHGAGHGVGLQVHEGPRVGGNSQDELVAGNIITIEPGLYYPEFGGIRIEDDILVTDQAAENLTVYPKRLVIP